MDTHRTNQQSVADSATVSPDLGRYARQTALAVIRGEGQARLARCTVVIVGCGALGGMQAELAARAGIGRLVVIDRDVPELHNLQRQILVDERDVRERVPKAAAAARRLQAINSAIRIEGIVADVTPTTVANLLGDADLILDGTDNFETRYLLNDAAVSMGRPWVYGGVLGTAGTVMAVRPGRGPCLRCILPEPPASGDLPTCETEGVLNTAVAWVAALQLTEALKILVAAPAAETRLHQLDVWSGSLRSVPVARRPDCVCCGRRQFDFLAAQRGSATTVLCGRNAVQVTPDASAAPPDFARLKARFEPLGTVTMNGLILEVAIADRRLLVFPDGRVLVMGTTDAAAARSLVARLMGA